MCTACALCAFFVYVCVCVCVCVCVFVCTCVCVGHASPGLAKMSGLDNLASTEELNQSEDDKTEDKTGDKSEDKSTGEKRTEDKSEDEAPSVSQECMCAFAAVCVHVHILYIHVHVCVNMCIIMIVHLCMLFLCKSLAVWLSKVLKMFFHSLSFEFRRHWWFHYPSLSTKLSLNSPGLVLLTSTQPVELPR